MNKIDIKTFFSRQKSIPILKEIACPLGVIEGKLITKEKRHELYGHVAGGSGSIEPENYQRKMIREGTGIKISKTNVRLNLRSNELKTVCRPNKFEDGFDYSENFDGVQEINEKKVYVNLKCVVGKGGAQTRSLREVYWFIQAQLNVLKNKENIYFANVLDGDEAYSQMGKYNYLCSLKEYEDVKGKIYVGDLRGYFSWFRSLF